MSDSTTNRKLLEVSGLETCFLPGKGRRITQESVRAVDEVDILGLPPKAMRAMRRHMQIILQDPYGSMRPRCRSGKPWRNPSGSTRSSPKNSSTMQQWSSWPASASGTISSIVIHTR